MAKRSEADTHAIAPNTANDDGDALLWIVQQQALCTYKNQSLTHNKRFEQALRLLQRIGLSNSALSNGETLCLGAAIYTHLWEHQARLDDLYRSQGLYVAAWGRNRQDPDSCYAADNAAFIYDQIAFRMSTQAQSDAEQSEDADGKGIIAADNRRQALQLRQAALDELTRRIQQFPGLFDKGVYRMVTLANLQLGIGMQDPAYLPIKPSAIGAKWNRCSRPSSAKMPLPPMAPIAAKSAWRCRAAVSALRSTIWA